MLGRVTALDAQPAFATLSPELRDAVRAAGRPFRAPAGTVLFDLEQACAGFVFVLEGSVDVTRPHPEGRELLLYRLEPGDTCVLTLNCLLGEGRYPARGVVRVELVGVQLPREVFGRLIGESASFRSAMLALLSARLTRVLDLLEATAFSPVDQRLAGELLDRGPFVRATQAELAEAVGSVREVVSRQLSGWARSGWVRTGRGVVEVLDAAALRRIVEPLGRL